MKEEMINIQIQKARMKIMAVVNATIQEYNLPAFLIESVLNSILLDVKGQSEIELIKSYQETIDNIEKKKVEGNK